MEQLHQHHGHSVDCATDDELEVSGQSFLPSAEQDQQGRLMRMMQEEDESSILPIETSSRPSPPSFPGADDTPTLRRQAARPSQVLLLFLAAVGSTAAWTAVLSNLVYYTQTLGDSSFLQLNLAVYSPLLPMALAQAKWDAHFDRQYNSWASFSFRGHVGYLVTFAAVVALCGDSHYADNENSNNQRAALLSVTTILGTASGILQGSLRQMASVLYCRCGRLPAAVTSGMQASAIVILVLSVLQTTETMTRWRSWWFGSSYTHADGNGDQHSVLVVFYRSIAVLVLLCWGAFYVFMSQSRRELDSLTQRDRSSVRRTMTSQELEAPLVSRGYEEIDSIEMPQPNQCPESQDGNTGFAEPYVTEDDELSYTQLWFQSWPYCVALMVTVASSMSIASWFNRVQSVDPSFTALPQVLFYTRILADLLGRPATLLLTTTMDNDDKPTLSFLYIGLLASLRLIFVPYFFLAYATSNNKVPRSDVAVIAGVAAFAFSSGFVVTLCYQVAPSVLLSSGARQVDSSFNATKQARLLNVCFSASVVLGLMGSLVLSLL